MAVPEVPSRVALVADDDALIRRVLALALEEQGWAVHTAAEADAALAMIDRLDVSLCIMDRAMPGASLDARLAHLATRHPTAARIVLSGSDEPREHDDAGTVWVQKPLTIDELHAAIDRAFAAAELRSPAHR